MEITLYHYGVAGDHNMVGSDGSKAVDSFRSSVRTIPQDICMKKHAHHVT